MSSFPVPLKLTGILVIVTTAPEINVRYSGNLRLRARGNSAGRGTRRYIWKEHVAARDEERAALARAATA